MFRVVFLALGVPGSELSLPLGAASALAALSPSVRAGRVGTRLLEGGSDEAPEALAERILKESPDLVGFSVYSWNRERFTALSRLLRKRRPGIILIAGGPEAGADAESLAREQNLDAVVEGEAEGVLEALVEELASARGKAAPPPRPLRKSSGVLDPAALPSPWLAGTASPAGHATIPWELSRGCPFNCSYCYEGRGQKGVRPFPRNRLEAELELFLSTGVGEIFVLDPSFNAEKERALALLALFKRKAPRIRWKFEIRAELLDRAQARAFAALDASLQIGLQSADSEVLRRVGRPGFEPERFSAKLALLDEAGARFGLDLIYGLPGDTLSGFKKSLDYALERGPNHLDVFRLAVLPGTVLAEEASELGLRVQTEAPHLLLSSPTWPEQDIESAARLAAACDLFYSKGRAVPWFPSAMKTLKRRPAAFLERFAAYPSALPFLAAKPQEPPAHRDIESLQLAFLEEELRGPASRLYPALADLVRLNGAWARALAEGESTRLGLRHHPEDLMGPLSLDIPALARRRLPRALNCRVKPGRGGPALVLEA